MLNTESVLVDDIDPQIALLSRIASMVSEMLGLEGTLKHAFHVFQLSSTTDQIFCMRRTEHQHLQLTIARGLETAGQSD